MRLIQVLPESSYGFNVPSSIIGSMAATSGSQIRFGACRSPSSAAATGALVQVLSSPDVWIQPSR